MANDSQAQALRYLQGHRVMTLATRDAQGVWAAAVFYVSRAFTLYFLSAGHTRHAQAVQQNPQVAATIQEDYHDWPAIQGIQLSGTVTQLAARERTQAIALYQDKFPFIAGSDPQIAAGLRRVNWYRLVPSQLYFIDNSRGLGHREAVSLKPQSS